MIVKRTLDHTPCSQRLTAIGAAETLFVYFIDRWERASMTPADPARASAGTQHGRRSKRARTTAHDALDDLIDAIHDERPHAQLLGLAAHVARAVDAIAPSDEEFGFDRPESSSVMDALRSVGLKLLDALPRERRTAAAVDVRTLPTVELALWLPQLAQEIADDKKRRPSGGQFDRQATLVLQQVTREVRGPITSIVDQLSRLTRSAMTLEQRERVEAAEEAALSVLHLVNDLADLASLRSGRFTPDRLEYNLRDCVAAALRTLEPRAVARGNRVEHDVATDVPTTVTGDPGRVRQVLATLAGNALAAVESGTVTVAIVVHEREDDFATLRITIESASHAADAGRQPKARSSTAWRGGGSTGLGLSISRQLVAQMGGRTWVATSENGGSALNFTVRVGLVRPRQSGIHGAIQVDVTDVRTLVVEPQSGDAGALIGALHRLEVNIEVCRTAQDARQRLSDARDTDEPFHVALVCVDLAARTGVSLSEAIAAFEPDLRPPLALLTSNGQRGDAAHCRRVGIAAYLTLPVGDNDLADTLTTLANPLLASDIRKHGLLTRHYLRELRGRLRVVVAAVDPVAAERFAERVRELGHSAVTASVGADVDELIEHGPHAVLMLHADGSGEQAQWLAASRRRLGLINGTPPALLRVGAAAADGAPADDDVDLLDDASSQELSAAIEALVNQTASERPPVGLTRLRYVERDALLARLGGDRALLQDVSALFLRDVSRMLGGIRAAIQDGSGDGLMRAADALKGSFEVFDVRAAIDISTRLTDCGRREDFSEVPALAERLEHITAAIIAELSGDRTAIVPPPGAGADER